MPHNAGYYHLAYVVASAIYVAYSLQLAMKRKKLKSERSAARVR
jgi:hypothetical protein